MDSTEFLRIEHITKQFPGVKALNDVSFSIDKGTVHGLVGENGAGKSTLIKILTGVYGNQYEGNFYIEGEQVTIKGPIQSKKLGLQAVYQDVTMASHLTVGENFFLGKLPRKNGFVDWKKVYADTQAILEDVGVHIDAKAKVSDLTVAQQEMVMIAKAMNENSRLVIFDEPTALLTKEDTELLFAIIRRMKENGIAVIYITHRMEELFEICDKITVLKDGQYVDTVMAADVNEEKLVAMMVGRELVDMYSIEHVEPGETALEVRGLTREKAFQNITFSVRKGEILGFYGLVGAGRTEVMRCIFGADRLNQGEILVNGEPVKIQRPSDAIRHGISFLPEDRKLQGLSLALDIAVNVNLASYENISRFGMINLNKEKKRAKKYIEDLRIKTPSEKQRVGNLSGGNQQKTIIGKWLCRESDIFIFDEPTVGIDVNAKREIYRILENLIKEGKTILFVSSYLPELFGIADRVVVFSEGRQMGEITKEELQNMESAELEKKALLMASGIDVQGAEIA